MDTRAQLEQMERSLHAHAVQLHAARSRLAEMETAIANLSDDAYMILGNIMVKRPRATIHAELERERELARTRIATLERAEAGLRAQFEKLQHEVLNGNV